MWQRLPRRRVTLTWGEAPEGLTQPIQSHKVTVEGGGVLDLKSRSA
jgi:hypothetical protein